MSTRFLAFQLYGPMASWGEIAVGEERDTADRPTRTAVLGLCAAALGLPREAEDKILALNRSLGYAVRVDHPGDIIRDYHTAQAPRGKRARDKATRRDEIAYGKLEATLTKRQYRTDAVYSVALWLRPGDAPYDLAAIADALNSPTFTLYLGRKSCPLAAPMRPRLIDAHSLREALEAYRLGPILHRYMTDLRRHEPSQGPLVYWDSDATIPIGIPTAKTTERWDRLVSRARWQFARRNESRGLLSPTPSSSEP